ncbi:MAG TPA: ATP-binding protein, partial [Opitutales bacterium]|nr:ATP-binding protein [Opitutales bacterium]
MSTKAPERHEFQAEVKQVLDIVVHSLYTDKEIFVRELISNASDATEKLRHTQLTEKEIFDADLELEIQVTADEEAGEITIRDFGIGMTHDELIENLGTIAHSGSKAFLNALKESGEKNENLIGQFGVGFYSVFMVADKVDVYTRSWHPEGECLRWSSDGSGA